MPNPLPTGVQSLSSKPVLTLNVHSWHLEIFLKCRFWVSRQTQLATAPLFSAPPYSQQLKCTPCDTTGIETGNIFSPQQAPSSLSAHPPHCPPELGTLQTCHFRWTLPRFTSLGWNRATPSPFYRVPFPAHSVYEIYPRSCTLQQFALFHYGVTLHGMNTPQSAPLVSRRWTWVVSTWSLP